MKMRFCFAMMLLTLFASQSKAWNCSDPLASRVDVGPTKPAGSTAGDGDGQYYIGSDASNPKDYYVCQVPKPPTSQPSSSSQTQSQQQSQNTSVNNSNTNSNSNVNTTKSQSNSSANSTSGVANSGNSTNTLANKLANSGNSQSTNTNNVSTAASNSGGNSTNTLSSSGGAGGAGGQGGTSSSTQSQSANSSAANNGNGSNNTSYNSNTDVEASKIPVATALALAPPSNLNCSLGYGAGVQTSGVGASIAFSKVDKNCAALTTALVGKNRLTFCKVYITNKYAKLAHVSLEDCLGIDQTVVITAPPAPIPQPVQPTPVSVTVVLPPTPIASPVIKASEEQYALIGTCTLQTKNGCKRIIDNAITSRPTARLRVVGPIEAGFVKQYAAERRSSLTFEQRLSDDQNNIVSIYLLFPPEEVAFGN